MFFASKTFLCAKTAECGTFLHNNLLLVLLAHVLHYLCTPLMYHMIHENTLHSKCVKAVHSALQLYTECAQSTLHVHCIFERT